MMGPAIQGARVGLAVLLQHHPLCSVYRKDRFQWGPVRVCSGCAVAFPSMLAGAAVGLWALFAQASQPLAVLAAGFVLGGPQLLTYVTRRSRAERAAIKLLGGLGIGLVMAAWPFLPGPAIWHWVGLAAFGLALAGLQLLRLRTILRTCDACPWQRDWGNCPGFNPEASNATLR